MSKKLRKPVKKEKDFSEKIIKILAQNANKAFNYKQIAAILEKDDTKSRNEIIRDLKILASTKKIIETEPGKYLVKAISQDYYEGTIDMTGRKTAYFIWKNPYMTIGSDTFIHEILDKLGFENVFKNEKRYPEISVEEMKNADFIFLSSEPFPFQQKHIDELQKELLNSKIVLVDGEAFSWYGTHLAKCGEYFFELVKSLG